MYTICIMNWPSNFRAGTSTGRDCAAVLALVAKRTPVKNAHVWSLASKKNT